MCASDRFDEMTDWRPGAQSPDDAVRVVKSGMRVFIHGAAATPSVLLDALARRTDLADVTLYHLHTNGPAPFADPAHVGRFFSVSLFTGPALRQPIADGRAEYVPVFLSDIPSLFSSGRIPIDVACCNCQHRTSMATARWGPRSMPRLRPRGRRSTSWRKSTSACRARTATRWCRFLR